MAEAPGSSRTVRLIVVVLIVGMIVAAVAWWVLDERDTWPRGEALTSALRPLIEKQSDDRSLVACIILDSYLETRSNASTPK